MNCRLLIFFLLILCSSTVSAEDTEEALHKCGVDFCGDTHFYIGVKNSAPIINEGNFRTQALNLFDGTGSKIYNIMEVGREGNGNTSLVISDQKRPYTFYELSGIVPQPNFVRYLRCLVTPIQQTSSTKEEVVYVWLGATNDLSDNIALPSGNEVGSDPHWKMAIAVKVVDHVGGGATPIEIKLGNSLAEATLAEQGWEVASGEFQNLNVGGEYPLVGLANGDHALHLYSVTIAHAK